MIKLSMGEETITTTSEHPFYVPDRGWVLAGNLCIGDVLKTIEGEHQAIDGIKYEKLKTPIKVYNFEVEDFHTYYVSDLAVLVHNANCGNPSKANSSVWKKFKNYKNGTKTSGSGKKKQYYEWDHTHNDIEVYNSNKKHLGSMDPTTGKMYKPAVKGRKLGH